MILAWFSVALVCLIVYGIFVVCFCITQLIEMKEMNDRKAIEQYRKAIESLKRNK